MIPKGARVLIVSAGQHACEGITLGKTYTQEGDTNEFFEFTDDDGDHRLWTTSRFTYEIISDREAIMLAELAKAAHNDALLLLVARRLLTDAGYVRVTRWEKPK